MQKFISIKMKLIRLTIVIINIFLVLIFCGCDKEKSLEEEPEYIPPDLSLPSFTDSTIQMVQGIFTITAEVFDSAGISLVDFYIDNNLMFTDTSVPYEYEWNTTEESNCSLLKIKVIAYDNYFNFSEIEQNVFIENQNPSEINVNLWYTSGLSELKLDRMNDKYFGTSSCNSPSALEINISTNETYQLIDGFGASLTSSSAWLINNSIKKYL